MLKITTKTEAAGMTLELEGKLMGPWVEEVERCWRELHSGQRVTVCLAGVTYIDDLGKSLLRRLHQAGAELKASGCMTRCIVEQVINGNLQQGGKHESGEQGE
jgi:hypothetical protein